MRVIDMECSVPKRATGDVETAAPTAPAATAGTAAADRPAGYGMANYERIFRSRQAGGDARPDAELPAYVAELGRVGIVRALPFGTSIDLMAGQLEGAGGACGDSTPRTGGLALEVVGESFLKNVIQPLPLPRGNRTRVPQ